MFILFIRLENNKKTMIIIPLEKSGKYFLSYPPWTETNIV